MSRVAAIHLVHERVRWRRFVDGWAGVVDTVIFGRTPLRIAVSRGHIDLVRTLIDRGAKLDGSPGESSTPLLTAMEYNHMDAVKLLLARGADPNKHSNVISQPFPLQAACEARNLEAAKNSGLYRAGSREIEKFSHTIAETLVQFVRIQPPIFS